ncbi:MAG: HepT-like ribonuclease domain-containing protein [Bacteroidia bacterium]
MFEKKNITYILTALEAIEKIFLYAEDFTDGDDFFQANDQMNFNATQTLRLVIGEETRKIHEDLLAQQPQIPWKLISSLRNRIAHDYRSVDPHISFDIIQNYLPELKVSLIAMIQLIEYEKGFLERIISSPHYRHLKYLLSNE